jgi:hypothetical protein
MAVRLSALRAGPTLPPGFFIFKDSWYSLLEAEVPPGPWCETKFLRAYHIFCESQLWVIKSKWSTKLPNFKLLQNYTDCQNVHLPLQRFLWIFAEALYSIWKLSSLLQNYPNIYLYCRTIVFLWRSMLNCFSVIWFLVFLFYFTVDLEYLK